VLLGGDGASAGSRSPRRRRAPGGAGRAAPVAHCYRHPARRSAGQGAVAGGRSWAALRAAAVALGRRPGAAGAPPAAPAAPVAYHCPTPARLLAPSGARAGGRQRRAAGAALLACSSTAGRRCLVGGGPRATEGFAAALPRASAPPLGQSGGRRAPAMRGGGAGWCSVRPAGAVSVAATRRQLQQSPRSTLLAAASSGARAGGRRQRAAGARCSLAPAPPGGAASSAAALTRQTAMQQRCRAPRRSRWARAAVAARRRCGVAALAGAPCGLPAPRV